MGEHDEFDKWRKRTREAMPALAARVFALRDRVYPGSRWEIECELGVCLARLNNYTNNVLHYGPSAEQAQLVLQVLVEELYKQVAKAEVNADRLAQSLPKG